MEFSIRDIKGIGPRKEALFARLHLTTVTDLLQYFPRDYEDRSHVFTHRAGACGTGGSRSFVRYGGFGFRSTAETGIVAAESCRQRRNRGCRIGLVQPGL